MVADPRPTLGRMRAGARAVPWGRDPGAAEWGREQVAQIQRARILAATVEVACERGAARVTVAHVVSRSAVSRRTFYELFADRDECLLAALDDALALACERVLPAYRAEREWRKRMRGGLVALLGFLDEQPKLGQLLVCESLSAGRTAVAWRNDVLAELIAAVDEGCAESKRALELSKLAAEGTVGAVLSILQGSLEGGKRAPTQFLANQLMAMIVLPYLGSAGARRELAARVELADSGERGEGMLEDPFKGTGMRLTYRTIRVLMSVAEMGERGIRPSNRQIGELAGISDQGQASKLLARLTRLELIENAPSEYVKGAPNAWRLTPQGEQLAKSVTQHTNSGDLGARAANGRGTSRTAPTGRERR